MKKIDFTPKEFHKRFPYLNDETVDPRLVGWPSCLSPFLSTVSGSRVEMFSSHIKQAMVTKGTEMPAIFSGFEMESAKYTFNETRRKEDVIVLAVIPRYANIRGMNNGDSPWSTVIYEGCDSKKVGYFNIPSYFLGNNGFGWDYKKLIPVTEGMFLPKEETVACSPGISGNEYGYGVNLNTVYLSVQEVIEDSIWISDRAAEKFSSTEYRTMVIDLSRDMQPLNRNKNSDDDVKIFPDIGECVGDDGILAAFRPTNIKTWPADIGSKNRNQINSISDKVFRIKPGSQIINMEFIIRGGTVPNCNYAQVERYHEATIEYWNKIYQVYRTVGSKPITREFNTLVTHAICFLRGYGVPLYHGKNNELVTDSLSRRAEFKGFEKSNYPVDFIQVEITYKTKREVKIGFKVTDRCGGKGIVSKITPLEEMPRDEYGNYADIVIDPNAVTNRLNGAQFWEQCINHISEIVKRKVLATMEVSIEDAFEILLEWLSDVRVNYANLVRETYPTLEDKKGFLMWIKNKDFIPIHIPPFYQGIGGKEKGNLDSLKRVRELARKWEAEPTHISWIERDENNLPITIKTKCKTIIGKKYVMCLEKIPHPHAPGPSRLSQFGSPGKPSGKEDKAVSENPVRMGEDEVRIMTGVLGAKTMEKLMTILGTSKKGFDEFLDNSFNSPTPTALEKMNISYQELIDSNGTLGIFHHINRTLGIDTKHTEVTQEDIDFLLKGEEDNDPNPTDGS